MRKSQYFPFGMFSAKQGHYWYYFYNVFGMMRSLTGNWTAGFRTRCQHSTTRLSRRLIITGGNQYDFSLLQMIVTSLCMVLEQLLFEGNKLACTISLCFVQICLLFKMSIVSNRRYSIIIWFVIRVSMNVYIIITLTSHQWFSMNRYTKLINGASWYTVVKHGSMIRNNTITTILTVMNGKQHICTLFSTKPRRKQIQ